MAHYEQMGLDGLPASGLCGKVVAFTMGEQMGAEDTYDVHFEKAFAEVPGAYPMINREFARWVQAALPRGALPEPGGRHGRGGSASRPRSPITPICCWKSTAQC